MPELSFRICGARAVPHTANPLLGLDLEIAASPASGDIQGILLRCQVKIDPRRLRLTQAAGEGLREVFGEASLWTRSLKPILWQNLSLTVPPFSTVTHVELQIPCTYDLDVAATKVFHALSDGHLPIEVLFSGTLFHGASGALQVEQIPWSCEASFQLPVELWRSALDEVLGSRALLALDRRLVDRLYRYRVTNDFATWEQTMGSLLDAAGTSRGSR